MDKKKKEAEKFDRQLEAKLEKAKKSIEVGKSSPIANQNSGGWIIAGGGAGSAVGSSSTLGSTSHLDFGSSNTTIGSSQLDGMSASSNMSLGSSASAYPSDDDIDAKLAAQEAENRNRELELQLEEQQREAQANTRERELEMAEQKADAESRARELESQRAQMIGQASQVDSDTFAQDEPTFQVESVANTESAAEIEAQAKESIEEAMGDGQEATNEMLEAAEVTLEAVKAETFQARQELAAEAPKFSQTLGVLMEQYSTSDSELEQQMVQRELEALLDGASDGFQPQVQKVRDQVTGMFDRSAEIWEKRRDAQNLNPVSAHQLVKERKAQTNIGQKKSDSKLVSQVAQDSAYYAPSPASVADDRQKIAQTLKSKGVTG